MGSDNHHPRTLVFWSPIGQEEIAGVLEETLEEEKQTDLNLSEIAENSINWAAEQEDDTEEE